MNKRKELWTGAPNLVCYYGGCTFRLNDDFLNINIDHTVTSISGRYVIQFSDWKQGWIQALPTKNKANLLQLALPHLLASLSQFLSLSSFPSPQIPFLALPPPFF